MPFTRNDLQDAVDKTINEINELKLRKLQKESYLNLAKCMDLKKTNEINQCMSHAERKIHLAQQIISNELREFQNSLHLCSMRCQDVIKEKHPRMDNNLNDFQSAQSEFDLCQSECIMKHTQLLRSVSAKIIHDLNKL